MTTLTPTPQSTADGYVPRGLRAHGVPVALALLIVGTLALCSIQITTARPVSPCHLWSSASVASPPAIRTEPYPPLPGTSCGDLAFRPPHGDITADDDSLWDVVLGMRDVWMLVFDLLPELGNAADSHSGM